MNSWICEWAKKQSFVKRKIGRAKTIEEIHKEVNKELNFKTFQIVERKTEPGFFMKLHRDDYHLDYYKFRKGIRDDSLWIPIYQEKRPVKTVIWYRSTQHIDFIGGNLRFFDGDMVRPEKDLYILFESNDPHEVTLQIYKKDLKNERHTIIIKYYE